MDIAQAVERGHRNADKELRNELLLLLSMVSGRKDSQCAFVDSVRSTCVRWE